MRGSELTPRELSVLHELARCRGNREAAEALGISERTVKAHIKNILEKLGGSSRSEAVAKALRLGLV